MNVALCTFFCAERHSHDNPGAGANLGDGRDLRPFGDFSIDPSVTRFNDGKPDPWGSFWVGTMAVPEDSGYPCSLYRLSPDGAVTELVGGVGLSNGLDWTDDRRVFYYSD